MSLIDSQIDHLTKALRKISAKEIPAATSSAINKTLAKARARVIKGVSKKVKIPTKHIRKRTFISRSAVRKQRGKLTSYLSDIPVSSLMKDPRPRGRKDKRAIKAAGRSYPGAFINRKKGNKSYQVYKRTSEARYPIEIQKIEVKQDIIQVTKTVTDRVMKSEHDKILAHELEFRLSKYAKY